MKTIPIVLLSGVCSGVCAAAGLDLSGQWRADTLDFPSRVTLHPGPPPTLIGGDRFVLERARYLFDTTGVSDPDEGGSATYVAHGDGRVLLTEQDGVYPFQINAGLDVMLEVVRWESNGLMSVIVREPATLALPDLAGAWVANQIEMPRQLSWNNASQQIDGGFLFHAQSEQFAIQSDGTVPDIGSLSIQDKSVRLVTEDGADTLHVNAAKDVMVQVKADTTPEDQKQIQLLTVLTKKPATLAPADIVGSWRISEIELPAKLTVRQVNPGDGAPPYPVLEGGDDFAADTKLVLFRENGTALTEHGELVPWSVQDGAVLISSPDGPNTFAVNASKNVLVHSGQDEDGVWFTVLTRTPEPTALPEPAVTVSRPEAGAPLSLVWQGGVLQEADSPAGPWLSRPDIRSPFQVQAWGTQRFYQVTRPE